MKSEVVYALTIGLIAGLTILGMRSCRKNPTVSSRSATPSFGGERNANCHLCGCDK